MDTDPVVIAYRERLPIQERLRVVQTSIAESAAELAWLRERPEGSEPEDLLEEARSISRRIRNLKKLVELDLAVHRADLLAHEIAPGSPEGQRALQLFYDRIVGVVEELLHSDVAAELVERFSAALTDDNEIPWPPTPPPDEPPPEPGAAA